MALAEDSVDQRPARLWAVRLGIATVVVLVVGALAFLARTLISDPPAAKRQVAKVSILPDTPPPPPPPREEPKREQPKQEQPRPQQQVEQPKPVQAPPAEAPIKMEGAAGDGPSAFAAGAVTQDYKGGAPTVGGAGASAPAPVAAAVDRANERFYANTARQLLRDELQRQLKADAGEIVATLAIWIEADGQIGRFELQPSGQPERDAEMRSALDATARALRLPPPPPVAQPMRFRVTLRPQG